MVESIVIFKSLISAAALRTEELSQRSAEMKVKLMLASMARMEVMTGSILLWLRPTRMNAFGEAAAREMATSAPREPLLAPVMRTLGYV